MMEHKADDLVVGNNMDYIKNAILNAEDPEELYGLIKVKRTTDLHTELDSSSHLMHL